MRRSGWILIALLGGCGRIGFDDLDGEGTAGSWRTVSVGAGHICAIAQNGGLFCWGENIAGQCAAGDRTFVPVTQVGAQRTWADVSAGYYHTCARRTDNSLWCWGEDSFGQLGDGDIAEGSATQPQQVPGEWAEVRAGAWSTCARKVDGTLWCWGSNTWGQLGLGIPLGELQATPTQVGNETDWTAVFLDDDTACGLRANGDVYCWGENGQNQLGDSTGQPSITPVALSVGRFRQLSLGDDHVCGILESDEITCWGSNGNGELGDGTTMNRNLPISPISGRWLSVSAGGLHTCAIRDDETTWCWGSSNYGEFGTESTTATTSPRQPLLGAFAVVSAKRNNTCWVDREGVLSCAGKLSSGQHNEPSSNRYELTSVDTGWSDVAAGHRHMCGVQTGGETACWGSTQIGDGTAARQKPKSIARSFTKLAGGGNFTLALDGGTLWGWGYSWVVSSALPVRIGTASNWRHITAGFDHACAINAADELWCWGYNERGQLGIGSQAPSSNLVQVPGLWMDVAAGDSHTCALTSSSVMRCWGHNRSGQLGSGSIAMLSTSPVDVADQGAWTSVASGFNHSCGLRSDSSLWCWGNNQHGQLDDMTVMDRNRPFRLPTFSDWTGMASGDFHMCGFRAGDQLWCWGHTNELGPEIPAPRQMGIGRQWVRYSSGYHFGCAISTSGERWCWGRNDGGQLGDGNAWGNSIWEIPPP